MYIKEAGVALRHTLEMSLDPNTKGNKALVTIVIVTDTVLRTAHEWECS